MSVVIHQAFAEIHTMTLRLDKQAAAQKMKGFAVD
jgi:hypothetical protein